MDTELLSVGLMVSCSLLYSYVLTFLWIKRRTEEARQQYIRKRDAAKSTKRKAQKDSWKHLGEDLKQDLQNSKKLLYSIAKSYEKGNGEYNYSIKDYQGNLFTEPEVIDKRWKEYFRSLLNIEEDGERTDEEQSNGVWVDEEEGINESDVKKAQAKIKNNKACGIDNIPREIFKYGGEIALSLLTELLSKAWDTGEVPNDLPTPLICPEDHAECSNYRCISLFSHTGKIYERVLEARLRNRVERILFRPNRGTLDLIFALKIILEKSWEFDKDKYVTFLDLEKAYQGINCGQCSKVQNTTYPQN